MLTELHAKLNSEEKDQSVAELIKEITALSEDLNCVFEWHDGILVEAM